MAMKTVVGLICIVALLLVAKPEFAQMEGMDISPILEQYSNHMNTTRGAKSDAKSLEDIQMSMIKLLFLDPFFEESKQAQEEEKEEEGDDAVMGSDLDMQSDLFSSTLARKLAKDDMLKLNKRYLKNNQINLPSKNRLIKDHNFL